MIKDIINKSKNIVVKIGSNTLAKNDGKVNKNTLANIVKQIIFFKKEQDKKVVLVSSGARISGAASIDKWLKKEDMHYKQALCAVGQVELMLAYKEEFKKYGVNVGQLLLTKEDFSSPFRVLNIRNTLFTLIEEHVVPIINENDTVCVEEIKIGDNDTLAANTSNLWSADLLIMLSDIDGLYDINPKQHKEAKLIEIVSDLADIAHKVTTGDNNEFGTGGIATKLDAAAKVNKHNIPMILTNGKKEDILFKILEDKEKATLFVPSGYPSFSV